MSFVLLGQDGSQVYIIEVATGLKECVGCDLDDRWFAQLDDMLAHLAEHRAAGHVVPEWVDQHLRDEWEDDHG